MRKIVLSGLISFFFLIVFDLLFAYQLSICQECISIGKRSFATEFFSLIGDVYFQLTILVIIFIVVFIVVFIANKAMNYYRIKKGKI